jgi:hypothetical protein
VAVFTIDLYIGFGISDNRGFCRYTEYAIRKVLWRHALYQSPCMMIARPGSSCGSHKRGWNSVILLEFTAVGYEEIDAASISVAEKLSSDTQVRRAILVCPNMVTEPHVNAR